MREIKIDDNIYKFNEGSCQLSLGSHATLYYSFDILKNESYKKEILYLFDNKIKFNILSSQYVAKSSIIKSIDLDKNFLNITVKCDILEPLNTEERREDILEQLLNSTFNE